MTDDYNGKNNGGLIRKSVSVRDLVYFLGIVVLLASQWAGVKAEINSLKKEIQPVPAVVQEVALLKQSLNRIEITLERIERSLP